MYISTLYNIYIVLTEMSDEQQIAIEVNITTEGNVLRKTISTAMRIALYVCK